jgi:hypothetical protein
MTLSATGVTAHELTAAEDEDGEEADDDGEVVEPDDCVAPTIPPPITPPTTRAAPAAAQGSHRRPVLARLSLLMISIYRHGGLARNTLKE